MTETEARLKISMHAGETEDFSSQAAYYKKVGVFAEVFSETICYLLNGSEDYFEAFADYKENYDDILSEIDC